MARIPPFHSSGNQPLKVHHDDDTCPNGLSILGKNRVDGTGGHRRCAYCRDDDRRRADRGPAAGWRPPTGWTPPDRLGYVVGILFAVPALAVVRWRDEVATFEPLDVLVEVVQRLL
jgi:hypothetical protein